MTVNEKIKALRDRMSRHNIDIYIVPTCDFHGSEYVGDYFKQENLFQDLQDRQEPLLLL